MSARLLILAALVVALPASAQSGASAYAVPTGSAGHRVELTLAAGSAPTESLTVQPHEAPAWLLFRDTAAPAAATDDGGLVATLAFDVARSAPVGEAAAVRFDVYVADGRVVGSKTLTFRVDAPPALAMGQPFPNPTRGGITVPFEVPVAGAVRLAVVDVLGREVAVLADGEHEPGAYVGRLPAGGLAAGSYIVRLTGTGSDGGHRVQRFTVVR